MSPLGVPKSGDLCYLFESEVLVKSKLQQELLIGRQLRDTFSQVCGPLLPNDMAFLIKCSVGNAIKTSLGLFR
jgi:hypothetical protein